MNVAAPVSRHMHAKEGDGGDDVRNIVPKTRLGMLAADARERFREQNELHPAAQITRSENPSARLCLVSLTQV